MCNYAHPPSIVEDRYCGCLATYQLCCVAAVFVFLSRLEWYCNHHQFYPRLETVDIG